MSVNQKKDGVYLLYHRFWFLFFSQTDTDYVCLSLPERPPKWVKPEVLVIKT